MMRICYSESQAIGRLNNLDECNGSGRKKDRCCLQKVPRVNSKVNASGSKQVVGVWFRKYVVSFVPLLQNKRVDQTHR